MPGGFRFLNVGALKSIVGMGGGLGVDEEDEDPDAGLVEAGRTRRPGGPLLGFLALFKCSERGL